MPTPTPTTQTEIIEAADDLLRCAKATAYESADALSGSQRDHALAVVHLIDMARLKLDEAALRAAH